PYSPGGPSPWQAFATRASPAWLGEDRPSLYWTRTVLDLIVKHRLNPVRASRVLALLHAAMHDALVRGIGGAQDERIAWIAVHRAASLVLADLFPEELPERFEALGLNA